MKIRLGIPKGSLQEATLQLFARAGLPILKGLDLLADRLTDPKLGPRKVDIAKMYSTERYRPTYGGKMGLPIFLTRA